MLSTLTLNKPNITDYAKERNDLLNKSKNEWNLFLDSDEKITQVNQLFSNTLNQNKTAYYLYRKNYFLGQYVGTDKIIRLVKKGTGKFVRKVHEVWLPDNFHLAGGIINDSYIIHDTAVNLSDYLKKMNYYSDLHAEANLKEGKKSNLFKIIFFPIGKFFITLIKSKHVVFSITQSLHSYLAWSKLYFLQH